jgi:hypothetical protein
MPEEVVGMSAAECITFYRNLAKEYEEQAVALREIRKTGKAALAEQRAKYCFQIAGKFERGELT